MKTSQPMFPWLYLLLAYGLAWLFWIPVTLTGQDFRTSPLLMAATLLGTFGPGIAGIILTYREGGRAGGREYWSRVIDIRRISLRGYAMIFLLFPALGLIAVALNAWIGGDRPEFTFVKESMSTLAGILGVGVLYLLQAGLEELGWRGYMLDRLQRMWKPLTAALVLGMFHTFWHLPTFWMAGTMQSTWNSGLEPLAFVGFVVSGSIYSTGCYNGNRRSILATILLHTTVNFVSMIFALTGPGKHLFNLILTLGAVVVAVAWTFPAWRQKQVVSI